MPEIKEQFGSGITPRSLYVHVPFCRHRCGYCNFTLVANRDEWIDRFLRAIRVEIESLSTNGTTDDCELDTLFLGGGTPSHLSETQLGELVSSIFDRFSIANGAEVSLEANPSDTTETKLKTLAGLGFNRVSLGAQSFNDRKLKFLERDHSGDSARGAIELCNKHFKSVSLDLIFGTPGESKDAWQRDLDSAIRLKPDHISTYGLTIEKGTTFWSRHERNEFQSLSSDTEADLYSQAIEQLSSAGFAQYEISNFAQHGHRCRHNEIYWSGNPFFAIGPGAASFVDGIRRINHQSVSTYLKKIETGSSPVAYEEKLDPMESAKEHLVIGLRRMVGVDLVRFQQMTGFALDDVAGPAIERLICYGLLNRSDNRLFLTDRGVMLYDSVAVELQ